MAINSNSYIPRLVDLTIKKKLEDFPAVYIQGPKWCGKTTACKRIAASALELRDPDVFERSADAAAVKPSLLLQGDEPRLIDEWQLLPVLWDTIINEVDKKQGMPGRFLLTGSATPTKKNEDKRKHTGTGRIARVSMLPMSLYESGKSTGTVSIGELFQGASEVSGMSDIEIEDYSHLICQGGWPAPIARGSNSTSLAAEYIRAICEIDLEEAADQAIDPMRARALLRSIARSSAQEASYTTLLADVKNSGMGMSEPTLRVYLNALRRLFVVEPAPAWAPSLRSKTPLRSAEVWHLCDPSLAAAALEADEKALLADLTTMGFLFESLCVRDLRAYLAPINGDVFHYRDKTGLEVDIIARLTSGAWAGIEVKLGGAERIEEAAKNLLKLSNRVDHDKSGAPAFLMVLTGGKYAYTREDGVHVVPLGCLKN